MGYKETTHPSSFLPTIAQGQGLEGRSSERRSLAWQGSCRNKNPDPLPPSSALPSQEGHPHRPNPMGSQRAGPQSPWVSATGQRSENAGTNGSGNRSRAFSTHAKLLPRWLSSEESACQCRRGRFDPWVRKTPWRRKWQPTPVFLPGESTDRGAWRATVQGVAKSRTQLSNFHFTSLHRPHLSPSTGY